MTKLNKEEAEKIYADILTLVEIKEAIEKEQVSYGELCWLQEHKDLVKKCGVIELASWAGIPEEEWEDFGGEE